MTTRWSDPELEVARRPVRPERRRIGARTIVGWVVIDVVTWLILLDVLLAVRALGWLP